MPKEKVVNVRPEKEAEEEVKSYRDMTVEELDEILLDLSNSFDQVKKDTREAITAVRKIRDEKFQAAQDAAKIEAMSAQDKEAHLRVAGKIKAHKK